jgi:predicted nucleic acid-binding protein
VSEKKNVLVVAIDSMTLVWGIRKTGAAKEKIEHAGYLFMALDKEESQIIIPSIVLAEYLTPIRDDEQRARTAAAIGDRFFVVPFDAKDALLAARLFNDGKTNRQRKKPNVRAVLRADSMIVATAKNHGARVFYTDDNDCRSMASKIMVAKPLPTMPNDLWGYGK